MAQSALALLSEGFGSERLHKISGWCLTHACGARRRREKARRSAGTFASAGCGLLGGMAGRVPERVGDAGSPVNRQRLER